MKSIQSKMILLILIGIIVSITIISGVGIICMEQTIDYDSAQIMNLACREKAQELNNVFGRIEQSVEIMSVFTLNHMESLDRLSNDPEYLEEYTKTLDEFGLTIANQTEGAVAIYIRFNPEITNPMAGFFRVKDPQNEQFENFQITDLSKYSPDQVEYVGWYYIPVQAGKAVWLSPYYNWCTDIYTISYVIPIYKEDVLLGIVGMDIDFDFIKDRTDSIQIYETGSAFLADENLNIIHSRNDVNDMLEQEDDDSLAAVEDDIVAGAVRLYSYTMDMVESKVAVQTLENGMYLGVTAPVSEIDSRKNIFIVQILVMAFLIVMVFIFIAMALARTIVKPLKELNTAAREIAGGNLKVSLECKSKDEVGTLTESLREMANQLKIRIEYINNLAYEDKLTGIRNNTAYLHDVSFLKTEMQKGECHFAVFVVDINGLKQVNDTYGHGYGNELIITASKVAARVFGEENVYRIGGDEFAIIRRNMDSKECDELEQQFDSIVKSLKGEIRLSAAIGSAVYDRINDNSYESVFKRADGEMYKRKMERKELGETSTIERTGEK